MFDLQNMPLAFRNQVKVLENGCWLWTGFCHKGYGRYASKRAHKFAYQKLVGPVPEGKELDHTCRNLSCVNPAHLEPVSHFENCKRGISAQRQLSKTHCPYGHPYDEINTYVYFNQTRRSWARACRICRDRNSRVYRERRG